MSVHHDLIRYAAGLSYEDLPEDVVAEAKRMLLDTIGCIVAARATDGAPAVAAMGAALSSDAYVWARLADLMDFNEGYRGAHFGCGAIAAALSLARGNQTGGRDFLTAIVAGFETGARVMDAMGPYYTVVDGRQRFAPVWGIATPVTYAAVAAAVRLMRLEGDAAIEAFSLAGANSPIPVGGKWSEAVDLPNTKYCDAGWATLAGLMGAVGAHTGSTGLTGLLDDERGLLTILGAANADPAKLSADLGTAWRIRAVMYKELPCCGLIFGPLKLARDLLAETFVDPAAIRTLAVTVNAAILIPRFINRTPKTLVSRQFSLPHNLAMVLRAVPPGPLWQAQAMADAPETVRLRNLVQVSEYQPTAAGPIGACSIEIHTGNEILRRETKAETAAPRRRPPSTDAEIIEKFRAQVAAPQAEEIVRLAMESDRLSSMDPLIAAMEQARPR